MQQSTYSSSSTVRASARDSISELLEPLYRSYDERDPEVSPLSTAGAVRLARCASRKRSPVTTLGAVSEVFYFVNAAFAVSPALLAAGPTLFHSLLRGGESNYCCQLHSCATVRLRLRLCLRLYAAEPSSFACSSSSGATSLLGSTCVLRSGATCACFYSSRCRDRVLLVSRPSLLALPASSSGATAHSSPEEVRTRLRLRPKQRSTLLPVSSASTHRDPRRSACANSGTSDSTCVLTQRSPRLTTLPAPSRSGVTAHRSCSPSEQPRRFYSCSDRVQRVRPQGLVLTSTGTSTSYTHSRA